MTYDTLLWQIRHFIYQHFAETTHPPSVDVTAAHFNISTEEAVEYYKELHNRHALFLEPQTLTIRMAWPFSGVPTDFKVHADGKTYYANCAWDMLGIPVALHTDAVIEAVCTEINEKVQLEIKNGLINSNVTLSRSSDTERSEVEGAGEGSLPLTSETLRSAQSDMLLVHFPLPFARWYDDLVFT
jgi:hypothetical protein